MHRPEDQEAMTARRIAILILAAAYLFVSYRYFNLNR
jgi:hypothetical protein